MEITLSFKESEESEEIVNINDFATFIMSDPIVCGPISFRLANETLSTIIEITSEGKVQAKRTMTDAVWLGSHTVKFEYYLTELDPNGSYALPLSGVMIKAVITEEAESTNVFVPVIINLPKFDSKEANKKNIKLLDDDNNDKMVKIKTKVYCDKTW